ncbi:MAG: hypothetical protein J2P20_06920 [Pseudonocardia sp.]|nr:hypothetical protein [Pseudonocardia sp.]MBO0876656.1 hypothetical protein [Pseudonocardia sp.]
MVSSVRVEFAQLPPPEQSADRIFVTANAVIVLDGATAFVPVEVSAQAYADHLGRQIADRLTAAPEADLRATLAAAITDTAARLQLRAGESPWSTVAILREGPAALDALVLGDSTVRWGTNPGAGNGWVADHRLAALPIPHRERYRRRLRAGTGYDQRHSELLRELQTWQRRYRNTTRGYWIAETEPLAAYQAVVTAVPHARWAVLATDGALGPLTHLGGRSWSDIAALDASGLHLLLEHCHAWERDQDPNGRRLPRAKRHDDKTLAAVSFD